jgi:hypothetical protein
MAVSSVLSPKGIFPRSKKRMAVAKIRTIKKSRVYLDNFILPIIL